MLAEGPCRIGLRCPVVLAITFPLLAKFTSYKALRMPAVMGFGSYPGRKVSGVYHGGKSSPVGGSDSELFVVSLCDTGLIRSGIQRG